MHYKYCQALLITSSYALYYERYHTLQKERLHAPGKLLLAHALQRAVHKWYFDVSPTQLQHLLLGASKRSRKIHTDQIQQQAYRKAKGIPSTSPERSPQRQAYHKSTLSTLPTHIARLLACQRLVYRVDITVQSTVRCHAMQYGYVQAYINASGAAC